MTPRRFRIAFSFAGEKRDFVAKVADNLATQFGQDRILYDKYHEADFARPRLGRHLPKLYHKQADLVVVVLCKDYTKKEWPGLEWDAIFDLIKKRLDDGVMLCRFNHAKVPGLYTDAGFAELDRKTPQQTATLILERLAINEGKRRSYYTEDTIRDPKYFERHRDVRAPYDHLARQRWGLLSVKAIEEFVSKPRVEQQEDFLHGLKPEELFRRFKFVQSNGMVCNGTFLCFGEAPEAILPSAMTRCFHWPDNTGASELLDDKDFGKGLLSQFRGALHFLKRALRFGRTFGPEGRADDYEIPVKVLEEVVANALVHRVFKNVDANVKVSVYADRVEVASPGLLMKPLTIKSVFGVTTSHLRNPQIARIFYLSGIVERAGKGIQRIRESLAAKGLPPPEFRETPDKCFVVVLRRPVSQVASAQTTETIAITRTNNLPRLQPFFGREVELKRIRDALAPSARTWGVLIDGPGGMGKTSLAVRAAYDCPPGLFDRILFVSTKDRELDDDSERYLDARIIPGFIEMLNELARELKLTDFEKSPDTERPRLILEALRPLKALLVLDNLESLTRAERDQLFTFVKRLPGGCKAILTSRRRIGSGAEALILEKLSQDAALAMLAELAGHNKLLARTNEAERIVLYKQTGGNPLLLRWTAGQLGRGSCRTFTDALAYLRSCPEGNDPLEFIIGDIAREFTDAETKVLCALTYFTQPATVEHIATVAGADLGSSRREEAPSKSAVSQSLLTSAATPAERRSPSRRVGEPDGHAGSETGAPPAVPFDLAAVETALRTLANRSLVVPDQEERAYTLVPMVADFLRKKKPEVVAATGKWLEKRAYALIKENWDKGKYGIDALDAAWPTVAPAIPLFLAGPNPRLQTVCNALQDFLNFTGRWDEWLALNMQAETRAIATSDLDNAGRQACHTGYVHYFRQQADEVLACAARAATYWVRAKAGPKEQSIALRLRGLGHQLKRDYPAALTNARQSVELWRSLAAESADVAIGVSDVAAIEQGMKDYSAAERDYREALRIAKSVGYAEGVAYIIGNLAVLALDQEDLPQAEALAREALTLAENVGRKELVAADHYRLAKALLRQNRRNEALPHAEQAVEIFTQIGHPKLAEAQALLKECQA